MVAAARRVQARRASGRATSRATLAWPGTWRMARRWWRTGVVEMRYAASRRAFAREAAALRAGADAPTTSSRPSPACARRRSGATGSSWTTSSSRETERALHVRNAPVARGDLVARDRADGRRRGRGVAAASGDDRNPGAMPGSTIPPVSRPREQRPARGRRRRRLEDVPPAARARPHAQGAGAAPVPAPRLRRLRGAQGRLVHRPARRVLRHRRAQRLGQEHAAQVHGRDLPRPTTARST